MSKVQASFVRLILVFALFFFTNSVLYAQKYDGFDLEGRILSSKVDDKISLYLSGKYNYWFNPTIGVTIGDHQRIKIKHTILMIIFLI